MFHLFNLLPRNLPNLAAKDIQSVAEDRNHLGQQKASAR